MDESASVHPDLAGLRGRVAFVSGGSQGIGRAIVLALAAAGVKVAVAARRPEALAETVGAVETAGGVALAVPCDVRQRSQIGDSVRRVADHLGGIDILVNNAGGSFGDDFRRGELLTLTEDDVLGAFRMNVVTAFSCACAVVPVMRESGSGSIVNISSVVVNTPMAGYGPYSAAKAALTNLTTTMAIEWAPEIRVNALLVGHVDTARSSKHRSTADRQWLERHIALGRMGQPQDIAGSVVYLASDLSSWVTGAAVCVDGGVRSL